MHALSFFVVLYLTFYVSALNIPVPQSGCIYLCPNEDRNKNPWDNRTGQIYVKSSFKCFYQTVTARYGCRYSVRDGSYKAGLDVALCPKKAESTCPDLD